MEKELNIAAILKDKPQGTKLYDWLHNIDVELDTISTTDTETVVWCTNETNNNTTCHRGYSEFGTERGYPDGLQILFPSKQMRDWSKFAWKKGDVLVSNDGKREVLFKTWKNDSYTKFVGLHCLIFNDNEEVEYDNGTTVFNTNDFKGIEAEDVAQTYINTIEERLGGKLNLETLEIEKQPEFKDGDIVFVESSFIGIHTKSMIAIFNKDIDNCYEFYFALCNEDYDGATTLRILPIMLKETQVEYIRLATNLEKQQLFDALAKEGKRWNAENKQIEDLPKKCEFKAMDWCLMRDVDEVEYRGFVTSEWVLCQFSHYLEGYKFVAVGGNWFGECIPYNEETAHLLGTTDEWKGGEG